MTDIASLQPSDTELMPVDVFIGGAGDIVLVQEIPSIEFGERYLRIRIRPGQIDAVLKAIENARRGAA